MINKEEILVLAEPLAGEADLFVTEVKVSPSNDIEIVVDATRRLTLDDCATLSKKIQCVLDEKYPDYSLTLFSAGIGNPLSDYRQFEKIMGKSVEIVMRDGRKIAALLQKAEVAPKFEGTITIQYTVKEAVEGKKRKIDVEKQEQVNLADVKSIIEVLDIR